MFGVISWPLMVAPYASAWNDSTWMMNTFLPLNCPCLMPGIRGPSSA
jgi:hypothetical protein